MDHLYDPPDILGWCQAEGCPRAATEIVDGWNVCADHARRPTGIQANGGL